MKIGNLDINAIKVGAADCSIYLGDVKLYPESSQPFKYKFKLNDTSVVTAECDSSSAITSAETFEYKTTLVEAEVGDCVTSIGEKAFYFMNSIFTSVTISNSVTSIGNNAFSWNSGLNSVEIPNSVTSIGNNAFDSSSLSSITIPDSVTNIGSYAFSYSYSLTSVTIGSGVTSIGNRVFYKNSGLTSVTIEAVTPPALGSGAFDNTNNCPIYVPAESVEAYKAASNWSTYADRIVAIQPSTCYEIISEPITAYTSTTYDSVYTYYNEKWHMLNNLNQYEEYGVYDIVEDISSATTYEGKLGVVGTTEYQYSGGSWSVVGTYEDLSVTYEITDEDPSPYVGQELSTTFKIPCADVETIGYADLRIRDYNNNNLDFGLDADGTGHYSYMDGSSYYHGTVTNDGEYFYLSLPSEAPQSIVIDKVEYWNSTPIHIIVGSKQATVQYVEKVAPSSALTYSTVAEMESVGCPDVGIGQYCYTNGQTYKFTSNEEWATAQDSELAVKGVFVDGTAKMLPVGVITSVGKGLVISGQSSGNYDYTLKSLYVGNGVTSIGNEAFTSCKGITSVTLSDDVTTIGDSAFWSNENLLRFNSDTDGVMIIKDNVTSIESYAFSSIYSITTLFIGSGITSIANSTFPSMKGLTAVTIPNSVTSIGSYAFYNCTSLKSITCLATTPPTLSNANAFNNTNNCKILVPSASVNAYKTATNWSTYASRIQAIP